MSKTDTPDRDRDDAPDQAAADDLLPLEAITQTREYLDDPHPQQKTDAKRLRELFGRAPYQRDAYEDYKQHVYPGMLEHHWDGPPHGATREKGGTDCLATGPPGTGKSTWHLHLAVRLLEINRETVIWRGSTARSEWLPFAPVARVCLPAGVDVSASLVPKDRTQPAIDGVDLDDVVREVVRYDSVRQLNQDLLAPGMFHVVYPDPGMTGCQAVYEDSDEKTYEPPRGRDLFDPSDPSNHWWFGWVLDRVENGPYHWTSAIWDEIGDIASQSAQKDSFGTYQKIQLLKDCYVDARKTGLSLYAAGHSESDIHDKIRKKMRWRIQMPGQANPTRESQVVGFENIPMTNDLTSSKDPGEILVYNERNYDELSFGRVEAPFDHALKLSMGA